MILVVDGNSYISGKIAEHFFMNGESCCVSQCNCLECAAILTAALPFSFVLMDALTVRVGHDEFIRFRSRNPNVRILVYSTKLSGAEFSVVKDTALKAGADFFGDEFQVISHVRDELFRSECSSKGAK